MDAIMAGDGFNSTPDTRVYVDSLPTMELEGATWRAWLAAGRAVLWLLDRPYEWRRRGEERAVFAAMDARALADIGAARREPSDPAIRTYWTE